jgi:hypothetical protein
MSENEYSPAVLGAVEECFPANNRLEPWSPIPESDRVAVKRALWCLSHPALLAAGGPEPIQAAVSALGAAYAHLTRTTIAGWIELSTFLRDLRATIPKGQWLRCFGDSRDPLAETLPYSRQQAETFIRFLAQPAVLDPANWGRLPSGWTVVDTIQRAAKKSGQSVQALIDDGTIHRDMTRSEAVSKIVPAATARGDRSAAALLDKVRVAIQRYVAFSGGASLRELTELLRTAADELDHDLLYSLPAPGGIDITEAAPPSS